MLSKGGFLVYKCRRCGKIVKETHVPDVMMAVTVIVCGTKLPKSWGAATPRLTECHICEDKQMGVDLIGGEEDTDG